MILPIPTKYKGYNFRSRLEARWAVFFDYMNIQYHYEIEGFQLESGLYLPDFYLPRFKMFAEVKPCGFSSLEYDHLFNLSKATNKVCLMLVGPPDFKSYKSVYVEKGDTDYWDCHNCIDHRYYLVSHYFKENNFWWSHEGADYCEFFSEEGYYGDDYVDAVYAARGERFGNK